MRYHLDTEFHEDDAGVELISLALAADDGRLLYLVNTDYDITRASPWLAKHVVPHLDLPYPPPDNLTQGRVAYRYLAQHVTDFVNEGSHDEPVEIWGWFADYDWFLFCRMFGGMLKVPTRFPMLCMDTMQRARHLNVPRAEFPSRKPYMPEHNALNDALWQRKVAWHLDGIEKIVTKGSGV